MTLRALIRRVVPMSARQHWAHMRRRLHDKMHGIRFGTGSCGIASAHPIRLIQPIMPGAFYDNKITNISRGCTLLSRTVIESQESWSFWQRLHRPNAANGFVTGRNLVNGVLTAQTGGGLCQLLSMVYHLALLAGLSIIERHPHSIDIYEEHQRFTPLGADATVVWGFKDLRLHNPHPFPVSFEFFVNNGQLTGEVHAAEHLSSHDVQFIKRPLETPWMQIDTHINGQLSNTTLYEQKQDMQMTTASL